MRGGGRSRRRRLHRLPPVQDVERELASHLAQREEELIAAGWDAAAAQAEARRLFGDMAAIRRECSEIARRHARTTRRADMWSEFGQDLRYAWRWLLREPGFAVLAVVTLALGIGANSAAFGIVNGVLLAPLPYPQSERIVAIREVDDRARPQAVTWPTFADWREASRGVEAMAAYGPTFAVTVLGGAQPASAPLTMVSRDFFRVLGVRPRLGRDFMPEEVVPGGRPVVVVSDRFWRERLGARARLDGVTLRADDGEVAVIGVMPSGFDFPGDTDLWYPLELSPAAELGSRTAHNYSVIARLRSDVTFDQARAELTSLAQQIRAREGTISLAGASVQSLRETLVGSTRRPLLILLGASAFVLLVACTNLASALLARASRRQRELAVRASLGAHRLRLVRQLLTESLLLAVLGAAAGLGLAHVLMRAVVAFGPAAIPRLDEVRVDAWMLGFTTLLAVLTALTFGTAPALRATTARPYDALQESGRATGTARQRRAWSALVGAEVALAMLLLVGSGLLIRSFWKLVHVDPGFRTDGALAIDLTLPGSKYATGADRVRYYDRLLERVRALPGVSSAAITMTLPLAGWDPNGGFAVEGGEAGDGYASYRVVSPDFFETSGTEILRGRAFSAADRAGGVDVMLINEQMAQQFFAGRDPIGLRIMTGGMDSRGDVWTTVIGVVADVRYGSLDAPPPPAYYLAYAQRPDRIGAMTLLVRSDGRLSTLAPAVRSAIRALDADVPFELTTLADRLSTQLAGRRFLMLVLGIFAGAALVLAAVGIYGVVSFAVAQRTREIGIRVALGARHTAVIWLVARSTMIGVSAGIISGLVGAALLSRLIEAMLFETAPTDLLTFTGVATLLFATAWLAVLVPARRALRVDPITALRAQ